MIGIVIKKSNLFLTTFVLKMKFSRARWRSGGDPSLPLPSSLLHFSLASFSLFAIVRVSDRGEGLPFPSFFCLFFFSFELAVVRYSLHSLFMASTVQSGFVHFSRFGGIWTSWSRHDSER